MLRALIFASTVAFGWFGNSSSANAAGANGVVESLTICAHKRTGEMRLGPRCRKGETKVVLSQSGPAGSPGQVGPQGPAGQPGPMGEAGEGGSVRVFDNDSQFLGFLMSQYGDVYVPSLKAIAGIDLDNSSNSAKYGDIVEANLEGSMHYGTPDCTGSGYFWPKFMETGRIIKKEGKYYVAKGRPPVRLLPMSHLYQSADPHTPSFCDTTPWDKEVWVTPGFDYTEVTLPFRVPVAFPLRME